MIDGIDFRAVPTADLEEVLPSARDTAAVDGAVPRPGQTLQRGHSVGRYLVLGTLGAGGMGVVYSAYDPELDRKVALKLLLPGRASRGPRLLREAQAMAKLSHPNVVAVHDVGTLEGGRVYVAMEFIDGPTLWDWLAEAKRPWRQIVDMFVQAGRGLAVAHREGLIHRDFKPDNVMVDGDGRARVMDFGLARAVQSSSADAIDEQDLQPRQTALSRQLTAPGAVMGTPGYMAPEQFCGLQTDARTDQFGYCVALWEALCGEPPFAGDDLVSLTEAVTSGQRRAIPSDRPIPAWLRRALERGLSVDPEDRWPSMDPLLAVLSRDRTRRWTWLGGAALAVGGLAAAAWPRAEAEQTCTGASAALAEVWNDARRQSVRTAILYTERSFAPDVWSRIDPQLDRWADAWATMHRDVCEATRRLEQSDATMDLRMECLHRAKLEFGAAVDVLASADVVVVQHAHELVGGLQPLSRCADVESLRANVEPPRPDEADAVEEIRLLVARSKSEVNAGRYAVAQTKVDEAKKRLAEVQYEPVRTDVALAEGSVLYRLGRHENSETILREALILASTSRQWETMLDAAVWLMWSVGSGQRLIEHAMRYRDLAQGLAAGNRRSEMKVKTGFAALLDVQGRHAEAEIEWRQALVLSEELGSEGSRLASLRNNLANTIANQGRYDEAETEHRRTLTLREKTLGPRHPDVAISRSNLAIVLAKQGRDQESETEKRRALAILEDALGLDHPNSARLRMNLASALFKRGEYAEAEREYRRVLGFFEKALGPEHPDVAMARGNLASTLHAQGNIVEAEREHRQALALWETALGSDHQQVALSQTFLAASLLELGRVRDSIALSERAWARCQRDDVTPMQRAETAFVLARALRSDDLDDDQRARAAPLAKQALEVYTSAGDPGAEEADKIRRWLAAGERDVP